MPAKPKTQTAESKFQTKSLSKPLRGTLASRAVVAKATSLLVGEGGDVGRDGEVVTYRLVKTAIGTLALVWADEGLRALTFPLTTAAEAERETLRRHPGALALREGPRWIEKLSAGLQALLSGDKADLRDVKLDLKGIPDFHARIYRELCKVQPGETVTYGELARRAGSPQAARAVGQAMAKNPFPLVVPCHRVLASGGRMCGFSAPGGIGSKQHLLSIEGAL